MWNILFLIKAGLGTWNICGAIKSSNKKKKHIHSQAALHRCNFHCNYKSQLFALLKEHLVKRSWDCAIISNCVGEMWILIPFDTNLGIWALEY